jgi:hemerythrin superfamily protein
MNLQLGKDKMDVLDLIKAEHRQIETLFSEIESTDDTYKLYECFNQLSNGLNLHAEVEEQTFYPAIRNCKNTKELVEVAQEEHDKAKQMLEELEYLSPTSGEFKQKIAELKQLIQHHLHEEENEVFSQVRECMSQEEREQLGSEFEAVKSKLHEMSVAS